MLMAISNVLLGIGLCMCGWHLWRIYRRIFLLEVKVGTPSASHNTASREICADFGGDNALCVWGGKLTCGEKPCRYVPRKLRA